MVMSTEDKYMSTPLAFFDKNPVFTRREFVAAHSGGGRRSLHTTNNVLAHHVSGGHLLRIRRGLYATVGRGVTAKTASGDPYLIATKAADDAVVAYHAALQFHGRAQSVSSRFAYLTRDRKRPFRFRGAEFVAVPIPKALRDRSDAGGGILERRHEGGVVRVTTLERALVDVLDTPRLGGGWEEIWRSLESVEFFDLDAVIEYALALGSALTAAKVGFYLEQHRAPLMVEDAHLAKLRARAPAQPRYIDGRRDSGKLVRPWNLIVPEPLVTRPWAEVA